MSTIILKGYIYIFILNANDLGGHLRIDGRVVYLVSVETPPLYLLGHKMVNYQVSSNDVKICNLGQVSGGLHCI